MKKALTFITFIIAVLKRFYLISQTVLFFSVLILAVPTVNALPITLTDSIADFGLQGENNWYYGYTSAGGTGFTSLPDFCSGMWRVSGYYWTKLYSNGGHPNGNPVGRPGKSSAYHSVVRRWVSETEGEITISGMLRNWNTGGGDGIKGRILIDGEQIWSRSFGNGGSTSFDFSYTVQKGDNIDFYVDPKAHDAWDGFRFHTTITTEVSEPTVAPEPSTAITCIIGTIIFGFYHRRKRTKSTII